jgi:hypothetical protein
MIESGGPIAYPECLIDPGYFPPFSDPVLNPC